MLFFLIGIFLRKVKNLGKYGIGYEIERVLE